jgi:hypothetical protein
MKTKIKIRFAGGSVLAEIDDSLSKKTAIAILAALPITSSANRWGDEIYFEIPVAEKIGKEKMKQEMDIGDIAYWVDGHSLCLFFGRTPVSAGSKPMAAVPVNIVGKIVVNIMDNIALLKEVEDGEEIRIEKSG